MGIGNEKNLRKAKPGQRFGGRQKGTKNKIPQALKEKVLYIIQELERKGKGLDVQAEKNPDWFFEHFLKPMLPKNVDITGDIIQEIKVEFVKAKKAEKD